VSLSIEDPPTATNRSKFNESHRRSITQSRIDQSPTGLGADATRDILAP